MSSEVVKLGEANEVWARADAIVAVAAETPKVNCVVFMVTGHKLLVNVPARQVAAAIWPDQVEAEEPQPEPEPEPEPHEDDEEHEAGTEQQKPADI